MAKNCSAGKAKRKSDRFSKRIKSAIEKRKAARKLARQKRKARKHVTWTYIQDSYAVVIAWLNGRFDISEHEYLFGVVSFDKVRILEILRAIVLAEFKKGGSIKVNELEQAYREAVKKIYTDECDIDRLAFAKDSCEAIRETFFYRAEEYVKSSINNSSIVYKEEDITELAANQLKKFAKNDLRTGTAEIRNHKRREVVKEILENISSGKKFSIKKLAKAHGISNKTASKYIKQINFMLINGIEFQEDVFNEKKRGPKENPYLRISKEEGESLFHAIDHTTPEEHGLEETVWSAKAAHDFLLKYFNKDIDIQYLYYFLHRHDYRSKSASRKNPMIDDSEVEEFKRTLKDKFRKSIENNEIIVFLDECHAFQTTRNQGYARQGSKTFYSHKPNNSHCNYSILSIIGFDFEIIFTVKGTVTTEKYIACLETMANMYPNKKFVVFRDNARIHDSEEFFIWLFSTKYNKIFRYEELPRYSPNLNPVEYLNNEFKNYLKKFVCKNEDDLVKRMDEFGALFIDETGFASIDGKRKARKYFRCKECSFIIKAFIDALLDIREEIRNKKLIERIKGFHILDKAV